MSGDLIFGDVDGVLVIPAEHIEYVIEKALEKARGEKNVRKAIEKGMSATEAFATFGYTLVPIFLEQCFSNRLRGGMYDGI